MIENLSFTKRCFQKPLAVLALGAVVFTSLGLSSVHAEYEDEVLINQVTSPFPDVAPGTDLAKAASYLHANHILGGFPDGTFQGDRPVNRAEISKFLLLAAKKSVPDTTRGSHVFQDVMDGEWYVKYIMAMYNEKFINGYPDRLFRPANTVNRAEFLKMLSNTFGRAERGASVYRDVTANDWYYGYTDIASRHELFGADRYLYPSRLMTRKEVTLALYRFLIAHEHIITPEPPVVLPPVVTPPVVHPPVIHPHRKPVQFQPLGADTTIDVGDNFIEIGKFRLTNPSQKRDVFFRKASLRNLGTLSPRTNLENVALYVSGQQVSSSTYLSDTGLSMKLGHKGYRIAKGRSAIFSIRADIKSTSDDQNTLQFAINDSDHAFVIVGGRNTKLIPLVSENLRMKTYTVEEGDLNVSRDPSSVGNQEYAPGATDVVFLTARVVVDQPVLVEGIGIGLRDTEEIENMIQLNQSFDNFRLFLNDKLIDTENDFKGGMLSGAYLDFNTTFEIAGTSILKVVGNIEDEAETGMKAKVTLSSYAFRNVRYVSTDERMNPNQLLGLAESSWVEVLDSNLKALRSDVIGTGTKLVSGIDDVTVLKFILDNNDGGDVNITNVGIQSEATGSAKIYPNFTAAVFVDGTQQGSAKNLDQSGGAAFSDLSVLIPSSGQKEFMVVVDTIEASYPGSFRIDMTDITAENIELGREINVTGLPVQGSRLDLVSAGRLELDVSTLLGGTLEPGQQDVEVLKIKLAAIDDEVQIKDLYFENDLDLDGVVDNAEVGDRLDFKLYNEQGQLIQEKNMINGKLHFDLGNNERIRVPNGDSVFVSIKVDVRSISQQSQNGKQLRLSLDEDHVEGGLEAITSATGNDLSFPSHGWNYHYSTHTSVEISGETFTVETSEDLPQ